jgi:divalent metal cation (Fe/Co/Zn/Cd) transporter
MKLLNHVKEMIANSEENAVTVRHTALKVARVGLTVFLGWTILKGVLAILPGLFIAAVGYLILWKVAK